jgi:hypothetical protein
MMKSILEACIETAVRQTADFGRVWRAAAGDAASAPVPQAVWVTTAFSIRRSGTSQIKAAPR